MRMTARLSQLFAGLVASVMIGAATPPPTAPTQSVAVRIVPDYRLGAGDKIRVITFGEEALSGEFFVSGAGKIAMPLVGDVIAVGLTAKELQTDLETKLRDGYLLEPRVSVEVLTYRPFYILGEVKRPGEYPYTNGLTVDNAVATAQGYTYRANTKRVVIRRADSNAEEEFPITSDTPVAPGDTIRIKERMF